MEVLYGDCKVRRQPLGLSKGMLRQSFEPHRVDSAAGNPGEASSQEAVSEGSMKGIVQVVGKIQRKATAAVKEGKSIVREMLLRTLNRQEKAAPFIASFYVPLL